MTAIMVVYMNIEDDGWIEPYFAEVPKLLTEYGAISMAASRAVKRIEGDLAAPDRIAVFSFPSMDALDSFMDDPRYVKFRDLRQSGARSKIFVFENAVISGELV